MGKLVNSSKKAAIGLIGFCVLLVGIVAIPYPGPGWLIVFAGLGILATEFEWAQRALDTIKMRYDAWQEWIGRQNLGVKIIFWLVTAIVVVVTIWLLNGYGIVNDLLQLNKRWLTSPLLR